MKVDFTIDEVALLYDLLADKLNAIDFDPERTLDPIAILINDIASRLATMLLEYK